MNKAALFLGVDPEVDGGLAVVQIVDGAAPVLVECIDIPTIGTGAKERVDVAAIRNFIDRHKPVHALVERAQAMPRQVWSRAEAALIALYGAERQRQYGPEPHPHSPPGPHEIEKLCELAPEFRAGPDPI
jgi:hypothetical protein